MSVRTRRTRRTRVLAAAVIAAAALSLTACNSGEGVHDEGASEVAAVVSSGADATPSAKADEGASTGSSTGASAGAGQAGTSGLTSTGSNKGAAGTSGTTGSRGSSVKGSSKVSSAQGSSAKGASASDDESHLNPCTTATTKVTATEVASPVNHMLLTVTNKGSKNCDLVYYPSVAFQHAQSVPPVIEDSKPQAVVTLAPGESGYAGIVLSAADGSGSDGYTAKTLDVYFNDNAAHATPTLPAEGVYIDSSIRVTYWQYAMDDALAW